MRELFWSVMTLCLLACGNEQQPVRIFISEQVAQGLLWAAEDLEKDLRAMGVERTHRVASLDDSACNPDETRIVVLGPDDVDPDGALGSTLERQAYALHASRCDGGRRYVTRGGDDTSSQWAVYDLLRRMGVRYFHPEHTYYPPQPAWPKDLDVVERPFFQRRSTSVHRTHPVELEPPLDLTGIDMAGYQRNWIDWNVKHRQSYFAGFDEKFVGDYAWVRGSERGAGLNLVGHQQGGVPVISPDDPRPEAEQIAGAIEHVLQPHPDAPEVTFFGFGFNPTEFTEESDIVTVERITFTSEYLSRHYPNIRQETTNHGTAGDPTPNYGVRYFDLPQFAPDALGVKVHTLMFYDLERPAPVYGNEDFSHMLAWTREQALTRQITHFPESSWWLTFDMPVPLYLAPVTIEARQYDIDLLADLVSTNEHAASGVYGHRLFSTGQEWGYWMIDWCVARMVWSRQHRETNCIDEFSSIFVGADRVREIFHEVTARQVHDMRDPELIRYLVGSDDETEIAYQAGVVFHPLPPAPAEVLSWSDEAAAALRANSLNPLRTMAEEYRDWTKELSGLLSLQSSRAKPWLAEMRDGIEVFGLRAEHSVAVYDTVLALRSALIAGDFSAVDQAERGLAVAREVTERARKVIRRRERGYRYPAELNIVGDEPGTPGAIPNTTIYPYRVLSRTHRLFYWERPNRQLAQLFGEGFQPVMMSPRIAELGSPTSLTVLAADLTSFEVDWGDGQAQREAGDHVFAAQGFYTVQAHGFSPQGVIEFSEETAIVQSRTLFARGSVKVTQPRGASILDGLLPGFDVGLGDDGEPFWVHQQLQAQDTATSDLLRLPRIDSSASTDSLSISLAEGAGDMNLRDVIMTLRAVEEGTLLVIEGTLATSEVVDKIVSVGGFDRDGAVSLVAGVLGYTPETLPPTVQVTARAWTGIRGS